MHYIRERLNFLQLLSTFCYSSPHLLATLWSSLFFIKSLRFIHRRNFSFDVWRSLIFALNFLYDHSMQPKSRCLMTEVGENVLYYMYEVGLLSCVANSLKFVSNVKDQFMGLAAIL